MIHFCGRLIIFVNYEEIHGDGVNYLGFTIKTNNYGKGDWACLVGKIERKINVWCNRWLFRGGRLVFYNVILEAIPIY
jgi:hypothetical protein